MKKQLAALLLGMTALHTAYAEEKPQYDRIAFSVDAEKEVQNDVLTAIMYAEQQGQDTAAMADTVNQAVSWAMDIAKKEAAVESRTLDYTTNPVYADGRVTGWQVRQSIQLKSKDSKILSGLLGRLQEKLRIENINYGISPEVKASTEDELVTTVLNSFKKRAEQIKTNMGRSDYRIVRLEVQPASDIPPYPMYRMAAAESTSGSPAAPSLEAGKQKVKVHVQAEIELSIN